MERCIRILLMGLVLVALTNCAMIDNRPFKVYTVGYSTPEGNDIWIDGAEMDGRWGSPGGGLACCWEMARSLSGVFDRPMPKQVQISWLERSTLTRYRATVTIDENAGKIARNLPGYTYISSGEKSKSDLALIIGMAPGGAVTIWISNAMTFTNKTGRVIHVVGQAQAEGEYESPLTRDK